MPAMHTNLGSPQDGISDAGIDFYVASAWDGFGQVGVGIIDSFQFDHTSRRRYSEAFHELVPGSWYTHSKFVQRSEVNPYYLLPWAMAPSIGYFGTLEEVLGWLEEAEFKAIKNHSEGGSVGFRAPYLLAPSA